MGNWNINIQGVGCHHNNDPKIDANLMAAAFVQQLQQTGQTIESASFTYGGKERLLISAPLTQAEIVASELYTHYCSVVGGKAFNGDTLPSWSEFVMDTNKTKQVGAWRSIASRVLIR